MTDWAIIVAVPLGLLFALVMSPWGAPALALLANSRLARWAAVAAAVAWALLVAAARIRRAGRREALAEVLRANEGAKAARREADAASARRPDDELRRRLSRWSPVILVCIGLGLGGCATTSGGGRGGAFCETAQPFRPTAAALAAMSHDELVAMDAHNTFGEARCGWRPGRKP